MLEDKARELGRLIGQSTEYKGVKLSTDTLNADVAAVAVLKQMEQVRTDAQRMLERGEQPTEEMEQKLDGLLSQVQGNPNYQRAVVAQENFDKIMLQVNQWILDGIKKGSASPIITLS